MLKLRDEGIILKPTNNDFESMGVSNPGCVEKDGIIHMFYRAQDKNEISSIGYCQLQDQKIIKRLDKPILSPKYGYERSGLEDPRVVLFEGSYYLFYTAYDGKNARIAYAKSQDLQSFSKMGLISPPITYDQAEDIFRESGVRERYTLFEMYYKEKIAPDVLFWEKDASIFPKRIKGKIVLIHRVLPGIQIMYIDNFSDLSEKFWRNYLKNLGKYVVLDPFYYFESRNIGGGAPPIETEEGWLLIYHAVEDTPLGRIYHAGAALLNRGNPQKVIGRLKNPLFSPKRFWEKKGLVNNVVFPTGALVRGDRLYIYYGAADSVIGAKSVNLKDLLSELKRNPV